MTDIPQTAMSFSTANIPVVHLDRFLGNSTLYRTLKGARCSSVVRAFAHGAMGRRSFMG